jgi:cation:H+ antiporter
MFEFLSQSIWLLAISGVLSIAILVLASNVAVKKLTGLAGYFRISTTFMGVTVVSLATSIPEIAAHYTASFGILGKTLDFEVSSAVVLGANIGSDVIQQTLIMALVVLLAGGLHFKRYFLWKSMIPMIATTVMCIVLGVDGTYSRVDGLILFGTFLAYMYYLYIDERKHYREEDHGFKKEGQQPEGVPQNAKEAWRDASIATMALVLTVGSAMVALQITESVVAQTGIGGSLIGVVTLGVASALPELITAISGVKHGDSGISLGTLVGSNITNPLVAIGGGALISQYWVPGPLVLWDLPWETVTGAVLWIVLWSKKGKLGKGSAVYLIALYIVYILLRMVFFAAD